MAKRVHGDRLDSWKAIAAHLGKSVRTARRWEAEEGMPVHRQIHRSLGSVHAYATELDAWRRRRVASPIARGGPATAARSRAKKASIAVLPFGYIGPDPEADYLADGFTDEVIADLSKLRQLRVISRTSSMALKGRSRDARSIAQELQVGFLLEGTVRREAGHLRIAVRLVHAARDEQIWAEKYDGRLEEVFAIQERIARQVAQALEIRLSAEEEQRLGVRPASSVVAWQCVLQARQAALRWRRDSIDDAVRLLRNGLSVVGDNAELYAALGRAHLQYREAGIDTSEGPIEQAEQCVNRVLELESCSVTGLQLRGWIHYARGEIKEAVRDLKAALEADWCNPDTLGLLSNCYLISGRVEAARPTIERLLSVDPLTPLNRCLPGWAAALEGDFAAALGPYRSMFELDPGNPMARLFYAWILALNGQSHRLQDVVAGFPTADAGTPPAQIATLFVRALDGKHPQVTLQLPPGLARLAAGTDIFPRFLAEAYAMANDAPAATEWLSAAVDRGFINYPYLARHHPYFGRLRDHPPFRSLLDRVRGRWEAFDA